ncbi:MAG: hypothetical protein FGF48_02210 [Candidatus Brockarchaeota archaeon]|nr:hypothetical protein [Candidatus Brockarchaeota archaeon]
MSEKYHHHRIYLTSADGEVAKHYEELFEKTYHKRPHRYKYEPSSFPHYSEEVEDRGHIFDLWDLGIKGSPYEFHAPKEHLDLKGARTYLRGFFTGDDGVAMWYEKPQDRIRFFIRFNSKYGEGLEEIRSLLIDLDFHLLKFTSIIGRMEPITFLESVKKNT